MWVRNRYAGPGGGLYTGPGGGLYSGPSGGLYSGPDYRPFMCNWPPIRVLVQELLRRGMGLQARLIARAYGIDI